MAILASAPHFHLQNHSPLPLQSLSQPTPRIVKTLDRLSPPSSTRQQRIRSLAINGSDKDSNHKTIQDEEVKDLGVRAALSMLKFYKREISPLLPSSCRYLPTCSEYSMEAYKKYGVAKGTILTAWRLCRCNPFGGSGFDPPRWFDEKEPPEE